VQEITERAQNDLITYQYPQPINTPEAQKGVAEIYEDFVAVGKERLAHRIGIPKYYDTVKSQIFIEDLSGFAGAVF